MAKNNGTGPQLKSVAITHLAPAPAHWFAFFAIDKEGEEAELMGRPVEAIGIIRRNFTDGHFEDALVHFALNPTEAGMVMAEGMQSFRTIGFQPPESLPQPKRTGVLVPRNAL